MAKVSLHTTKSYVPQFKGGQPYNAIQIHRVTNCYTPQLVPTSL